MAVGKLGLNGVGLRSCRIGLSAGPFQVSDLFANGSQGVWYDPSDLTTLWQDTARTVSGAVDSPVAIVDDKSGNGNYLEVLSGTLSRRPMLRQDASGNYYLDFDGVDDFLWVPDARAFPITDAAGHHSSCLATRPLAGQAGGTKVLLSADGGGTRIFSLQLNFPEETTFTVFDAAGSAYTDKAVGLAGNEIGVVTQLTASGATEVFKNSVGNGSTAIAGAMKTGSCRLQLGHSNIYPGRFYQVVHLSRAMTASERSQVEAFVASKSGVTL